MPEMCSVCGLIGRHTPYCIRTKEVKAIGVSTEGTGSPEDTGRQASPAASRSEAAPDGEVMYSDLIGSYVVVDGTEDLPDTPGDVIPVR
jgi:hypothetical protein